METPIAEGEAVIMPPPGTPRPLPGEGDNMNSAKTNEKEDKKWL